MGTIFLQLTDPKPLLDSIGKIDSNLAQELPKRDSLVRVLDRLNSITTEPLLVDEAHEKRRLWQDCGLFYAHSTPPRFFEAIELFRRFHEKLCEVREQKKSWLPCGMPLVWISDFYRSLNCPHLAFQYLLLTGVSDAVRDKAKVDPNGGFYWRARWLERLSDDEISNFYQSAWSEYQKQAAYCQFPEFILSRIGRELTGPYPSAAELDIYSPNPVYAKTILSRIDAAHTSKSRIDGSDLEALAGYLLGCIPGFEVTPNIVTGDSQLDALIRNRGPRYDFRQDLGTYVVVECKDWGEPVGSKEVGWFINKLMTQDCQAGILFSSAGISGDNGTNQQDVKYAALTLLKAYQRAGKIVIVLNRGDFEAASRGLSLVRILQNKYEEVRFDVRRHQ